MLERSLQEITMAPELDRSAVRQLAQDASAACAEGPVEAEQYMGGS